MEKITIEKDKHGFIVRQGDKYADWLCYDEMFGVVVSLIMKDDPSIISRYLGWMMTEEQHEKREHKWKQGEEE